MRTTADTLSLNPNLNPDLLGQLSSLKKDELLAAIDLGSNSFHLAIARVDHGEVRKILSVSEKVQLAAGLDDNHTLSDEAMRRGLLCLGRFGQYLDAIPSRRVRVVATNALRKAVNRQCFIDRAADVLRFPIEVIAGREEARLIYLGVSHTNAGVGKRLVVDIGGGSTEFIVGQGFEPLEVESLQMGCVSFSKKFFADGKITHAAFDAAAKATETELLAIAKRYKKTGWDRAMGSSGTIKACFLATQELGFGDKITPAAIKKIKKYLIKVGDCEKIDLASVKAHRKPVFAAGVAQLLALMKTLGIEEMDYSDGALREGVMYDMLGRRWHEDVKNRSVKALTRRYSVSQKQAKLVRKTALRLFEESAAALGLDAQDKETLAIAAALHEVGLAISHSGYHHHSAYVLKHADMLGFSRLEQDKLATLVLCHRRKLKSETRERAHALGGDRLVFLCLLLRLAALARQSRSRRSAPIFLQIADNREWRAQIGKGEHVDLIEHQLRAEVAQFAKWGVVLKVAKGASL